jgi:hypothetical protein
MNNAFFDAAMLFILSTPFWVMAELFVIAMIVVCLEDCMSWLDDGEL